MTDYAIYMLDPSGGVASWNSGALRLTGYEAAEIVGHSFARFHTPEDRQAGLPEQALKAAAAEGRFESEGWRVRKDGALYWVHSVIDAIVDVAGELTGFAAVIHDLTERKESEEALRRSEHQFRLLVQGVTDYAIYMLDTGGRITSWNAGAERIKGYREDEIIGDTFARFYTEEDRLAGLPQRGLGVAAHEGRFENEGWRVRKNGARFWAHVLIDAIHDDGKLIGFAKVTRDITERKAAQTALEQAQLALAQAQKLESVGRLTGGVAHDFNNLLMAVLGSLELARKRPPGDPRTLGLLDNAMQAARRGAVLTQRMLAFARRQELKPEPVDVLELVGGLRDIIERALGPTITMETRYAPDLPCVLTDANQLETALLDLAANAKDAMPGGGALTISAEEETVGLQHRTGLPPGRYTRLSVTDTGEGMDEATLARAAEPFFSTKGVGKGTGLGLSMVHGLAEQSGGRLELASRPGEGATATLWLPVAIGAEPERPAATPPPDATVQLRILAVDDDNLVLMNTAAMLEDLGHQPIEANSGARALQIVAEDPSVDLVISDQTMPAMTGIQLANAIKALRPRLPVILATGYTELPLSAAPGLVRLAKPFTQHELATAVWTAAGRKAG
jgi:PAS domain S-box-containing protein